MFLSTLQTACSMPFVSVPASWSERRTEKRKMGNRCPRPLVPPDCRIKGGVSNCRCGGSSCKWAKSSKAMQHGQHLRGYLGESR